MASSNIIFAKLDPGFFSNRKAIRAGLLGREVYLFVLCANAQRGATGIVPAGDIEPWYLAHQLGITEPEASEGVSRAVAAELIRLDGDSVIIVGWDEDWSRRPLTRAEIQKNYRERSKPSRSDERAAGDEARPDEGAGGAERYAPEVTSDRQSNALPIRGEERRGERRGNAPALSQHARGVPLAWQPSTEAADLARERGLDLAFEAAQFRDHAKANGKDYKDPSAAFLTWLRRSRDTGRKQTKRAPQTKPERRRMRMADGSVQELEYAPDGSVKPVGG